MPAKTGDLPGVEGPGVSRPKIKAIETAADAYCDVRDTRMTWTEKEFAAKTKLAELMVKHELNEYVFNDHKVTVIQGKLNVKVRSIEGEEPGDDEGTD